MRIGLQITGNEEKYQALLRILKQNLTEPSHHEFIFIPDEETLKNELPALDILVCYRLSPEHFDSATSRLKWIHFGAAGIEHSLFSRLLESPVLITNARGIHGDPVSEFVIGAMLYFAKRFHDCEQFKRNRQWEQWTIARQMVQLSGKTLGIIGYGAIGKALSRKAAALGMSVIALRRRTRKTRMINRSLTLFPRHRLNDLLSRSDFVAITSPLTDETRGMIGESELAMMKPSAVIINVSRGAVTDERALVRALDSGKIAGAALDVFEKEPLPEDHPFFSLKNVLLSPHISGNFPEYQERVVLQFAQLLNRYITGGKLFNLVDKRRKY